MFELSIVSCWWSPFVLAKAAILYARAKYADGMIRIGSVILIALAVILLVGQATAEAAQLTTEAVKTRMAAYIAAYNAHDLVGVVALYDDDATVEDPAGSEPYKGKLAIRHFYESVMDRGGKLEPVSITPAVDGSGAMFFQVRINTATIDVIEFMKFSDEGKIVGMKAYSAFMSPP